MPRQLAWLHLAPGDTEAVAIHHASGIWMFLALAWLVARFAQAPLGRIASPGAPYPRLLMDLPRAVLFMIAVLLIRRFAFSQDATGLITLSSVVIAVIGIAPIGIAPGLQHPYRIGDWIKTTQGSPGKVTEITWRTTRLMERNGFTIVVPNRLVAGQRLINHGGGERDCRTARRVPLEATQPSNRAKRILLSGALGAGRRIGGPRAPSRDDLLARSRALFRL